jgi:methionine-gamma-lyase
MAPERRRTGGFSTRSVHPPEPAAQSGDPVAPVIDPSSTYSFSDVGEFAHASQEKVGAGYVYTRWANPTLDRLRLAVADLEGAEDAEVFSSGMAGISAIFLALCSAGDRIASVRQLYGNTYGMLTTRLPRYGIETTFADLHDFDAIARAAEGAKLLYCETIGNPVVQVADLDKLGDIAAGAGIPLVVDNTFASPLLCRPIEHGASIVVHSATKALGGHHDLVGGVVCGDAGPLKEIRLAARDFGPTMSPFNAWLALRGIATLELRVERACASALTVAERLAEHPEVERVFYPALEADPSYGLAARLLGGRGGATLGFDVAGGRERAVRFQEALRLIAPAASLGGTHSLIVHAASVTHTQLSPEELAAAGIPEGFCRLSIGLEDAEDLVEDLEQALKA